MFQLVGRDGRVYRHDRDIVYLFQDLVRKACYNLARDSWHEVIRDWAAHSGLTEADLVKAAVAMRKFFELTCNTDVRDLATAWVNSGLYEIPRPALMALMFQIGVGCTATWFDAVRDVTRAGRAAPGMDLVGEAAERAAAAAKLDRPAERHRAADEIDKLMKEGGQ